MVQVFLIFGVLTIMNISVGYMASEKVYPPEGTVEVETVVER